ncbi:hypothetical protein V8E54_010024 [Elaphomyces granulatus]
MKRKNGALNPQYCPRDRTVQALARLLEKHRVVHVRGTLATGKSTLTHFLYDFLAQTKRVILTDEWSKTISPTRGEYTPLLHPNRRVAVTIARNQDAPDICLFYDSSEYEDFMCRFYKRPKIKFKLDTEVQDYIYSLTNGHPGMIESVLEYVQNVHRASLERQNAREITLDKIRMALEDDKELFQLLTKSPAGRSLPSRDMQNGGIYPGITVHSITFDFTNAQIQLCFRNAWVHAELDENSVVIGVLPSPLHARFVEYYYGNTVSFPHGKEDFCLRVLKRFSASMLRTTRDGRRIGPSGKLRPPEAAFQAEFYRCCWHEVGPVGICSEWSGTKDGCIDFLISEPGWGIELLRDGNKITEHCNRFRQHGKYYSWIQQGFLRDWLILDCRHDTHQRKYPNEPRLWRIVFQEDYAGIRISDCNNEKRRRNRLDYAGPAVYWG